MDEIAVAARELCEALEPPVTADLGQRFDQLIVNSRFFGWKYQYSHGLSIYLPWSEPFEKPEKKASLTRSGTFLPKYARYDLTKDLGDSSWLEFLKEYFAATKRERRHRKNSRSDDEINPALARFDAEDLRQQDASWAHILRLVDPEKPTPAFEKPTGGSGVGCSCTSIKNYDKTVTDLKP
jgi:hypothetical protein